MTKKQTQDPILMDIPMPIETERLLLRVPQAGDGQALFDAIEETFDQVNQWMPWAKELGNVNEKEAICRRAQAKFLLREDMMLLAFDQKGKLLGATGLHRFDWTLRRFEIGYWVRTSEQNKGYATEIANALTRYAFEVLDARAVMIGHADGNERSKNVIQKLGLTLEGRAKFDIALPNGGVVDSLTYSRTDTKNLPELQIKYGGGT